MPFHVPVVVGRGSRKVVSCRAFPLVGEPEPLGAVGATPCPTVDPQRAFAGDLKHTSRAAVGVEVAVGYPFGGPFVKRRGHLVAETSGPFELTSPEVLRLGGRGLALAFQLTGVLSLGVLVVPGFVRVIRPGVGPTEGESTPTPRHPNLPNCGAGSVHLPRGSRIRGR